MSWDDHFSSYDTWKATSRLHEARRDAKHRYAAQCRKNTLQGLAHLTREFVDANE